MTKRIPRAALLALAACLLRVTLAHTFPLAYVATADDNNVSVIDTDTNTVHARDDHRAREAADGEDQGRGASATKIAKFKAGNADYLATADVQGGKLVAGSSTLTLSAAGLTTTVVIDVIGGNDL